MMEYIEKESTQKAVALLTQKKYMRGMLVVIGLKSIQEEKGKMSKRKWENQTANDVVTLSGCIWNDDTRTVANAVNYNAQILKDALNRIAELEKYISGKEKERKLINGLLSRMRWCGSLLRRLLVLVYT